MLLFCTSIAARRACRLSRNPFTSSWYADEKALTSCVVGFTGMGGGMDFTGGAGFTGMGGGVDFIGAEDDVDF